MKKWTLIILVLLLALSFSPANDAAQNDRGDSGRHYKSKESRHYKSKESRHDKSKAYRNERSVTRKLDRIMEKLDKLEDKLEEFVKTKKGSEVEYNQTKLEIKQLRKGLYSELTSKYGTVDCRYEASQRTLPRLQTKP